MEKTKGPVKEGWGLGFGEGKGINRDYFLRRFGRYSFFVEILGVWWKRRGL